MPLVAHTHLPTYDKLRTQGHEVLTLDRALTQDIRELHIGLLNMMPDAALRVTEQQYMRLIGNSNQIVQFYVHPFTIPGLPRGEQAQEYINQYYEDFTKLQAEGLDALIITGADPTITQKDFWNDLEGVLNWAHEHLASVLCSCLASHALLKLKHGIKRKPLPRKQWGVFEHRVRNKKHPLLRDINTRFEMPHSRWNEIRPDQLERAGLHILVDSEEAGVQLAVSPDHFQFVYFQGHPEYFRNSLLKEYKRDVELFINEELCAPPPHPENYFNAEAAQIDKAYLMTAISAKKKGYAIPPFPEEAFDKHLDNTWGDTSKAIFNNWLGLVYQLTDVNRHIPFRPDIDRNDPLGMKKMR